MILPPNHFPLQRPMAHWSITTTLIAHLCGEVHPLCSIVYSTTGQVGIAKKRAGETLGFMWRVLMGEDEEDSRITGSVKGESHGQWVGLSGKGRHLEHWLSGEDSKGSMKASRWCFLLLAR